MDSYRRPAFCTTIWIDVSYELKTVTRWTVGSVIFCLQHIIHVWNSLPQDMPETKIRFEKMRLHICCLFFRNNQYDIPQKHIHPVRHSLKELDYQRRNNQHFCTWKDHVKYFKMAPGNQDFKNYFLIWKIVFIKIKNCCSCLR